MQALFSVKVGMGEERALCLANSAKLGVPILGLPSEATMTFSSLLYRILGMLDDHIDMIETRASM